MPRVMVQTDDGITVNTFEFPLAFVYALVYMPSCPAHTGVHNLLTWLPRTLRDAANVQAGVDPRRLSEIVMNRMELQSYKIVRRYYRDGQEPEVIATGWSFKQAHDHVAGPEGRSNTYHDTYEAEGSECI